MKKITIILVSAVYFLAFIFVGIAGVVSEIRNQTVEVTKIVLKQASLLPQGGLLKYPSTEPLESTVTALYSRPDGSTPTPEGGDYVTWNVGGLRFDYVLQVRSFKRIYDDPNWKDGQRQLDLSAFVVPENATKQELDYSLSDAGQEGLEGVSVNDHGTLRFDRKLEEAYTSFLVTISATDNSNVCCYVRIIVAGYSF